MPRGWYLAQGLFPLGYSSSDDEDGPCELPDSRLVCGPHGFVTCGKCCTDYSFVDGNARDSDWRGRGKDDLDEDVGPDHPGPSRTAPREVDPWLGPDMMGYPLRRGTGQAFPTKFPKPSASITPLELFTGRVKGFCGNRMVHPRHHDQMLIFTDGACLGNGQPDPKAGWAFHFGESSSGEPVTMASPLERKGPFDTFADAARTPTSNRAELRAVIGALRFCPWARQGLRMLVLATDSSYVVDGATQWCRTWVRNNWTTRSGEPVKNRDLWETLLGEVEHFREAGLVIHFWLIPRALNTVADAEARNVVAEEEPPHSWRDPWDS